MKFGIMFDTHVDKWELIRYAEELGYDMAWVPDSQMIWSDCYATMALAAVNTKRIRIGTGVAIAGTRIAPVTAHSIASINQLAPGRVFLGIGTGHTAMRVMGQDPMPLKEFREYLRVVRALLAGEAVDYTYRGETREIKFIHRDRYFINLDNPIPIYIAANGPLAMKTIGVYGDGWMSITTDPAMVRDGLALVREGAAKVNRTLPANFHNAVVTSACVLRPGDRLTDDRVIDETGSMVTCVLHFAWEVWKQHGEKDELIPPFFADVWERYCERVAKYSLPEGARFRQIHDGHCTFLQPEERPFVTPEAIRNCCIVGTPEEIVQRIRDLGAAGINEVSFLPPADYQRKVYRDLAEMVFPAFR
ncbi:MAG: LLM class flavin-dependent oxidoreductase [Gammaproteobacteria bacterium]|nr:LLM class flavin-dependent oxidoreductase [Gammaproteobacteria bacterium]